MKTEKMNINEALEHGREFPFALVRSISSFFIGPTPEELPPTEELLEVRFFSEEGECRIFHTGAELAAVYVTEAPEEEYIDSSFSLENDRSQSITIRQTISYDDDGQAILSSGRLTTWKGGNGHA